MDPNNVFDKPPTIYEKSKKAIRSELNLVEVPATDISTSSSTEFVQCFPLGSIKEDYNPLEFNWHTDSYISLAESFLSLGVQVVKKDNTLCESADLVALCNLFFHSLFANIQLYLNNELVYDSNGMYAWTAYLTRLLGHSSLEKEGFLKDEFWYPNKIPNTFSTTGDAGFKTRYEKLQLSTHFTMFGKPLLNFFNQNRYLPPGTEIRLILRRNIPEFYLDCATDTKNGFNGCAYKATITEAVFYGAKKTVTPEIVAWHRNQLQSNATFKYPTNKVQIKAFLTATGLSSATSGSLLIGKIPKLIVIGSLDSEAFNGKLSKSGFNFENFDMSQMEITWNGESVKHRVFPFSFKNSDAAGIDNFLFGVQSLRKTAANYVLGNNIDIDNYNKGNVLVAVELLANDGNALTLNRQGQIIVNIKFKKPLPKAITTLLYCQYQSLFKFNRNKHVTRRD